MWKKDYIMDVTFDSLVNFIQSELQTWTITPDDKKLCSLDQRKPKISPLVKEEGLYWRVNNRHYFKLLTILMLPFDVILNM